MNVRAENPRTAWDKAETRRTIERAVVRILACVASAMAMLYAFCEVTWRLFTL